jgi:hypothetical protein
MKTYVFSFLVLLLSTLLCSPLRSNPIVLVPPEFYASELMFDSERKWIMELHNYTFDIPEMVDSVRITTSGGSAKWNKPEFGYMEPSEVFILRNDSLDLDLTIDSEGDFIQVTTYYKEDAWWGNEGNYSTRTLIFGNCTGASVRSPKEGESIAHVPYRTYTRDEEGYVFGIVVYSKQYAINPTPTVGQLNNGNVAAGKISARIHNPNNRPFSESRLQLKDEHYYSIIDLERQEDGLYLGNVYACKYSIDNKLYPWNWPEETGWKDRYDYWTINPVEFEIEQDTILTLDIYIDGYVNTKSIKAEETVLKIIPNPITGNTFTYKTTLPVRSAKSVIEIIGISGQTIAQYPVFEKEGKITLPSNIAKGIYNVVLTVNKKKYVTKKIIIQ